MNSLLFYKLLSQFATLSRNKSIGNITNKDFVKRSWICNSSSISFIGTVKFTLNTTKSRMPVIHAVAAHRHHHVNPPENHLTQSIYSTYRSTTEHGKHDFSELGNHYNKNKIQDQSSLLNYDPRTLLRSKSYTSNTFESRHNAFLTKGNGVTPLNGFGSNSFITIRDHEDGGRRSYSKSKDKGTKKKSVIKINENEMGEIIDVEALKTGLETIIEQMKAEYASQLSIRGTSGTLELLEVEYEGENYPLQELAQIGRKNPQLIVLNVASLPDACQPIIKAIQQSGMQLNPQQEGTTIYIPIPKVTREHRENLAKNAKAIFVKYKTSLQHVQNRFVKQCKSHSEFSEDLVFSVSQQIVKMTENYIATAEKIMSDKQKELLSTIS